MKTTNQCNLTSVKNEAVKALFRRKSLVERLSPVMTELLLNINCGKKSGRPEKTLPDYCYNIFKALRKAQFRILPELARLASDGSDTDWEALGKVMGAGLRCFRFGELEMDAVLNQEGLPGPQKSELLKTLSAIPGFAELSRHSVAPSAGPTNTFVKGSEELWAAFLTVSQSAYQSGCGHLGQVGGAFQKGMEGFLDDEGRCVVEHPRDNIYWFLLLVWPEIQEMQRAQPPVTRKDFAEWLQPFAQAGFVSIRDFDQLLDVCDDIGLKFKGRGAPKKK